MAVNHQHLRAFHAVANDGSFSKAARRLNISQPTLSQQVKALESRYCTNLFEARRNPLRLTPLGRELHQLTMRMFETSEEIEVLLRERQAEGTLSVRIVSDSPAYAAKLAKALTLAHPGAQLVMQFANAAATLQMLLDARADVAIACNPRVDPALVYKPLFSDRLSVVMASTHAAADGAMFPLEWLAGECLLLREPGSRTRSATEALLAAREIRPRRVVEMQSREAIREAVALGVGVSLFCTSECPPDRRLVAIPTDADDAHAPFEEYLVYSAEQRRSAVVQAVLAAAALIEEPGVGPVAMPAAALKLDERVLRRQATVD